MTGPEFSPKPARENQPSREDMIAWHNYEQLALAVEAREPNQSVQFFYTQRKLGRSIVTQAKLLELGSANEPELTATVQVLRRYELLYRSPQHIDPSFVLPSNEPQNADLSDARKWELDVETSDRFGREHPGIFTNIEMEVPDEPVSVRLSEISRIPFAMRYTEAE